MSTYADENYNSLTFARLKQLCSERQISTKRKKKIDLIEALTEYDRPQESENENENEDENENEKEEEENGEVIIGDSLYDRQNDNESAPVNDANNEIEMMRLRIELKDKELALAQVQERMSLSQNGGNSNAVANNDVLHGVSLQDVKCLLPKLGDSDDVLSFFQSLEKVLTIQGVERQLWHRFVPGQLSAKALKVFSALSIEQSGNYDAIKRAVLDSCKLTESVYLKTFRNMRRTGSMSYQQHLTRLHENYAKYIEAANITTLDLLIDAVVKEQFMNSLLPDVRAFVLSKQPKTAADCAQYAQLSFQVKQTQDQSFVQFRPQGGERAPFQNPHGYPPTQGPRNNGQFVRQARPPWVRGPMTGPNYHQQQRHGGPYFQRPPTNSRAYSPTMLAPNVNMYDEGFVLHDDYDDCYGNNVDMSRPTTTVCDVGPANDKFLVPAFINGEQFSCVRDTGNFGISLVAQDLIPPYAVDYSNTVSVMGILSDKMQEIPTTVVSFSSHRLQRGRDKREIFVRMGVCSLPQNVHCVLGNDLFARHKELTDIIDIRTHDAVEGKTDTDELNPTSCEATKSDMTDVNVNTPHDAGNKIDTMSDKSYGDRALPRNTLDSSLIYSAVASERDTDDTVNINVPPTGASGVTVIGTNGVEYDWPRGDLTMPSDEVTPSSNEFDKEPRSGETTRLVDRTDNGHDVVSGNSLIDKSVTAVKLITRRTQAKRSTDGNAPVKDQTADTVQTVASQLGEIDLADIIKSQHPAKTDAFRNEQVTDTNLQHYWRLAQLGDKAFIIRNNLLYKKIPSHITSLNEHALVLPASREQEVIELAHDNALAGHLGVRKTLQRLMALFHFPKMRDKIKGHVRTCKTCQLVRPIKKSERAPLQKVDVMARHAFDDITIDILGGQLQRTKSGNQYALVVICNLSKWPTIIPIRNLRAETVAEKLLDLFSFTGLPQCIRCDKFSSFTGDLMSALRDKLGIEGKFSSAFHPISHGSVERLNASVESVLKKLMLKHGREWDKLIKFINFALREVTHESTGYSPSELVYGHKFRGLLDIVREEMEGKSETTSKHKLSTAKYIATLSERIETALRATTANVSKSQERMQKQYNKAATLRTLKPGDKVLVLLPTSGNKLWSTWAGPYEVLRHTMNNNYEIQIDNRKTVLHINTLRKFETDDSADDGHRQLSAMVVHAEPIAGEDVLPAIVPPDETDSTVGDVTIGGQLTPEQQHALRDLVAEYPDVFSSKLGRTHLVEHSIRVTDDTPCFQSPYKIPAALRDKVYDELMQMVDRGVLQYDDNTNYCSPLVIIKKSDGSLRLVNNFIELNKKTVTEPYRMQDPSELLSRVAGARLITRIDLKMSFFQLGLEKNSQKYTGFQCEFGCFSYRTVAMGLKNSSFTMQRLIDRLLRGTHRFTGALIDDIIIFGNDFELHLTHIREILDRLRAAGLTANGGKCTLGASCIKILGHVVQDGQILPDPSKTAVIANWPLPRTKKKLKGFLGLTSYFRDFLPDYAAIAHPLTELLGKRKPDKLVWGTAELQSFDQLKQAMMSKPVLQAPDFTKDYVIMSDASTVSVSGILLQREGDETSKLHVVSYASRKLLPHERNYSVIQLELLAIVFSIIKFHHYVYGKKIDLLCDHRPLQHMSSLVKHSSRLARYAIILQNYDINCKYVKGSEQMADALTRIYD